MDKAVSAVPGIKGACPDCRGVVSLVLNPGFQDQAIRAKAKERGLDDDCVRYLTVPHEPQERHGRYTDQCIRGGRLPTRLVPVT